jgi:hypothetical protein
MNRVSRIARIITAAGIMAALAASASAQDTARAQGPGARGGGRGGAGAAQLPADALNQVGETLRELERSYNLALRTTPAEPVVRDAPYSGVGTTTTTQVLADGTRIERSTTTRVWRDRMGRVRREQTAIGLGALSPASDAATVVTITDPVAGVTYTLDMDARTARSAPLPNLRAARIAGAPMPGPPGTPVESLATREIEGVKAVGRRTTMTIPLGQIGNDRPFDVTYEQWESPELQILLQSRQSDPRTGIVEYRLTGLVRAEPAPDLFTVPPGHTVITQPGLQPSWSVAPGGGARGRGRSNSVDQFGTPDGN